MPRKSQPNVRIVSPLGFLLDVNITTRSIRTDSHSTVPSHCWHGLCCSIYIASEELHLAPFLAHVACCGPCSRMSHRFILHQDQVSCELNSPYCLYLCLWVCSNFKALDKVLHCTYLPFSCYLLVMASFSFSDMCDNFFGPCRVG